MSENKPKREKRIKSFSIPALEAVLQNLQSKYNELEAFVLTLKNDERFNGSLDAEGLAGVYEGLVDVDKWLGNLKNSHLAQALSRQVTELPSPTEVPSEEKKPKKSKS